MPRKVKATKLEKLAQPLGTQLALAVCQTKGVSSLRARREDFIDLVAEFAKAALPKVSKDELVENFHQTLMEGLHDAMDDAVREAKRTGDYDHGVLVEAFDRLVRDDIDSWTDE